MSTVADYIGRTVDVSAFHGVEAHQLQQANTSASEQGYLVVGHDSEILGWDAVSLWRVTVATEGGADFALLSSRQDNATADVSR